MKRDTKPTNIRIEQKLEEDLNYILKKEPLCVKQNWSKSELIRHFTKNGIKQWEQNMKRNELNV